MHLEKLQQINETCTGCDDCATLFSTQTKQRETIMSVEMRQFNRYDAILIAEARPFQKTQEYSVGITSNLSQDGFCFESQSLDPNPAEILEFKLTHPDSDLSVSALGEMVWKKEAWFHRKMGIKFSELEQAAKEKLLELVYTGRKHTELSTHGKESQNKELLKNKRQVTDDIAPTMVAKQKYKRSKSLSYIPLVVFLLVFSLIALPFISANIRQGLITFISATESIFSQGNDKRMINISTDDNFIKDVSKQELVEPMQSKQTSTESGQLNEVSTGNNEYYVQVGTWRNFNYAEMTLSKIRPYYPNAYIVKQNDFKIIRIPGVLNKKQGAIVSNDIEKKFNLKPMIVQKIAISTD